MVVAACGGSNETVAEPDLELGLSAGDVIREAGPDVMVINGVRVINGCRIEPRTQCPGVNLDWADLSGTDLSFSNFENARFWGANLTGVKLMGANLINANLTQANLTNVDTFAADLRGAWFCDTLMMDGSTVNRANCGWGAPRS